MEDAFGCNNQIPKNRVINPQEQPQLRTIHAIIASTLVLAFFFAPALFSSAQFLYLDTGRAFEPFKRYIAQELLQGRFPAWNPYSGLGAPLISGAIASVQHPFNLLLLPSFDVGFKLWIFFSYLLAAVGGFAWARSFGRSWYASVGAGLAFAISGFMVSQSSNLEFLTCYASIPLIFAAAHNWINDAAPVRLAHVGLASALCASAGDPQGWGFAILALPVYAYFFASSQPGRRRIALTRGILAMLISVIAAAPFVFPVVAWLIHSSRDMPLLSHEFEKWNLHPVRLLEFVLPNVFRGDLGAVENPLFRAYAGNEWTLYPWANSLYAGIVCLTLAALGAMRSRSARWLMAGAILFLWMAMGGNAGFGGIAGHIPIVRSFRYWEKLTVWPTLLVAMSSAFGFDLLAEDRILARRVAFGAGVAALIALLSAVLLAIEPDIAISVVKQDGVPAVAEKLIGNLSKGFLHAALACSLLASVLYCIAQGWIPAISRAILLIVLLADTALANHAAYYLSDNLHWKLPPLAASFEGENSVKRIIVPFGPMLDRWPKLDAWENMSRWWARTMDMPWNVPARVGNFRPYEGLIQDRMFRYQIATSFTPTIGSGLWGVSAIIVPDAPEAAAQVQVKPPYRVLGFDRELPAFAVEIPHRPRTYLAENLVRADEAGALRFALDDKAISSGIVVIESPVPSDWSPPRGEVRITHDEPCRTVLETYSDRRALIVLNDAFAPGWTAEVDGHAAEILPVNYLARGIWVNGGTHSVVFQYHTPLLHEGWGIFCLGAGAIVIWIFLRRRHGRSEV